MKLALVISSLQSGDAKGVLSMLANYWAAGGECVRLMALSGTDINCDALDSRVKPYSLTTWTSPGHWRLRSGEAVLKLRALRMSLCVV